MMTNYEEERQKEEERMQKRIEAQNRRVYGLLTNIVVSMITALIVTILLTR